MTRSESLRIDDERTLRNILWADTGLDTLAALVSLVFASSLSPLLGVSPDRSDLALHGGVRRRGVRVGRADAALGLVYFALQIVVVGGLAYLEGRQLVR